MGLFLVVFSKDKRSDQYYHRRSCLKAKALPPGTRKTGNAQQLRQWGYSPCPLCDPDNPASDLSRIASGVESPKKRTRSKKEGKNA
jgi:hypothetical protein